MSKRKTKRKNFGTGYGFTFHGAFTDKKDAEAKEKKTPGSFIKGTPTAKGYRWIVQKPRTNPRKAKRVVMVGDKKFSRWETARNYALKQAKTFQDRIAVIVRESDGTQLTHYVDPPARSNPETKFDRAAKRNQSKAGKLYQRMTALLAAGKFDRADKIQKQLARLAARMGWSMGYVASFARAGNPAELLVMGNPAELLVMGNPGDDPWVVKAAAELYPGKTVAQLTADRDELSRVLQLAAELKREARERGESTPAENSIAWGGRAPRSNAVVPSGRTNAELGEYENGVFYPLTRRPRSRHKSAVRRRRASNPAAADLREAFTGRPAEWVTIQDESHMPAGDYAKLGKLLSLYVKPLAGGQVLEIKFSSTETSVVADETGRQIYFVGGDQDVSSALSSFGAEEVGSGVYKLGEARRIDYKQRKEHVPEPEVDEWRHEFGEETGVRPELLFDSSRRVLLLEGGAYTIRPEGITN